MPKSISFGTLDMNLVSSMGDNRGVAVENAPFRILVLGDFSGRASRGVLDTRAAIATKRLHMVDRDDFEDVMAELGVKLRLPLSYNADDSMEISFAELDDFHPDRIYERLHIFRDMDTTIAKHRQTPSPVTEPLPVEGMPEGLLCRAVDQTAGNLLDQILEGDATGSDENVKSAPASHWDKFLKRVVAPHLVSGDNSEDRKVREFVDGAAGDLMRAVLQYPEFKELEAAWRGLKFLVSRLETGENLHIVLMDVSKGEIRHDLCSVESLADSALFRLLVENCPEEPWGLIAGNYVFDKSNDDIALLGRLAKVACSAGAPFVAAAGNGFLTGCSADDPLWAQLRHLSEAAYLGLATPGFLLRLPYGKQTDPVDNFDFEEMSLPVPETAEYLWGNPVFAVALLLGESFIDSEWEMVPGMKQELSGLPIHSYRVADEVRISQCLEKVFTLEQVESLLDDGLIPLLAFKERDMVRVARFQSIADPPSLLAGSWKMNC